MRTVNRGSALIWQIILGVLVSLCIFGAVWLLVLRNSPSKFLSPIADKAKEAIDTTKYVYNPLTGEKVKEADATWLDTRPLGVMVNNHIDARPQSGLIYADIIYEVVAEGGITRYLPFFLSVTPEKIGPVRSTREYYLVITKETGDAMLMHEGYSPQAKEVIDSWPVRSLFRGGAAGVANWRDNSRNVAFEHTLYTDGKKLREVGDQLGWQGSSPAFRMWQFKDGSFYDSYPAASKITIDFWYEGDYSGIFKYDQAKNCYLRFTGYDTVGEPVPLLDNETKEQVCPKNVVVQFAAEKGIVGDDKNRLDYELVGSGEGLIFLDGRVLNVTWTKESRDARTIFYDDQGREIQFNRGKFWISIVPDRNVEQVVFN